MTDLGGHAFDDYFRALHGYEPFPWQRRLVAQILEQQRWPDLLDIPTGLGKTSAIDIALFVLAARPALAPRRIILVVDRRVVVDQAADHAGKVQRALAHAVDGPLAVVAAALRQPWSGAPEEPPFEVSVMRGGMPRDESWAQRPDRPVVALSTVDQVGSRLLFRGYGVSAGMSPIHAGLLGQDALLLLDEVQLSTAFAETLHAIGDRWRPWRESSPGVPERPQAVPDRWAFVRMSATPVGVSAESVRFGLETDDLAHPIVGQRRSASKVATLVDPIATKKVDAGKTTRAVVEAFSKAAVEHLDAGTKCIAIIVNRVASACAIHEELRMRVGSTADTVLLTGRMRPLDRDEIMGDSSDPSSVAARVIAGRTRARDSRPLIVVATQTIEAGADFDFDAMVTECASIDALRQRLGRLDRRGELRTTRATILVRKDQAGDSQDDPVYGSALAATWDWLSTVAGESRTLDFGIAAFPALPEHFGELCSPVVSAPVMLPAHIDAWAQTNPRGEPDPEVALWLHGPKRGTPEVRLIWRADIDAVFARQVGIDRPVKDAAVEAYAAASLGVAPPSSLEAISVPLAAFRAWIEQQPSVDPVDVEGAVHSTDGELHERADAPGEARPFLIASKGGVSLHHRARDLYPEATVVVPASYGGIRHGNWNPDATAPVRDLGDWAQLMHRGRAVLRLVPESLRSPWVANDEVDSSSQPLLPASASSTVPTPPDLDDPDFEPRSAVQAWLERMRDAGSSKFGTLVAALLEPKTGLRVLELEIDAEAGLGRPTYFAAVGRRRSTVSVGSYPTSDIISEDDDSASHIGREVGLEEHLGDVERWVRAFSRNLHLGEALSSDLALAAYMHDIGKADPRFQQMLHGGSAVRTAASSQLLAKSRTDASDRAARERARRRAGYPDGYRHELLSIAMLQHSPDVLARAHDPDLVLHLVGSHHGWCRPFARAIDDGPSIEVTFAMGGVELRAATAHGLAAVDSGIADRYWLLTERYGWWTLAWLEALVRLADHRASEESARGTSTRRNKA